MDHIEFIIKITFIMIHPSEYVKELLRKHLQRTASASETEILMVALDLYSEEEIDGMMNQIDASIDFQSYRNGDLNADSYEQQKELMKKVTAQGRSHRLKSILSSAALIVIVLIPLAVMIWLIISPAKLEYSCGALANDYEIPTGSYSCSIKVNTGCIIKIDSTYSGPVTTQGNTKIIKKPSGILEYKRMIFETGLDTTQWMYNTIITAKGSQYRILLPDGSLVRLNAASSIRFPVEFSDSARYVLLEGEAYFDITANQNIPFVVMAGRTKIRVTGTSFNVNTYSNRTVATPIKGSLEICNGENTVLLKPGEQALVNNSRDAAGVQDNVIRVSNADTLQTISWKKVMHVYDQADYRDVVMDIERWFDLDIENISAIPKGSFSGSFCYDSPIGDVLKQLRSSGLNFILEGNRLVFLKGS